MVKTKINNHRGHRGNRHHAAEISVTYSNRFATRFSTPSAITSDCGTLPRGGNANFSPRQVITPEVNSILISSPGIIVLSEDPANCSRKRFASSGTSTHKKPLLNAFRK